MPRKDKQQNPNSGFKWEDKVVEIKRVTKVVKGGKRLRFRVVMVVGNRAGSVGIGVGKARDVVTAIEKGRVEGRKNTIVIPLTKFNSIPHPIKGKFGAANLILKPSGPGSGVIAGSSTRAVLELAGVRNVLSKQLGSNNSLNNARATINGLSLLRRYPK